jgi:transposase
MTSMSATKVKTQLVIGGVDTHQRTHHVVVIDHDGRRLGDAEFAATSTGYGELLDWVAGHGLIDKIGVESTGSYGAGLTRRLLAAGIDVIEVNRPDKTTRARHGKSDPIDAESAARQVLAGTATARPKLTTGIVEAIRMVKIPRDSAVKDRTRAYAQLRDLATTAPAEIHDQLIGRTGKQRVKIAAGYRPDPTRLHEPTHMAKQALRTLARRIQALNAEIAEADKTLTRLTRQAVPTLLAMRQVGPQIAAQLVITAGQNPHRLRHEAAFAKLCGVAPIPASSGKTRRMRLSRGGDRQANSALYLIVIGRLKNDPDTRAYATRREAEGLSKKDIIRCLKRHLARTTYRALTNDLMTP